MDIVDFLGETTKSLNKLKSYNVKDSRLLKHVFEQRMGLKISLSMHRISAVAFCGFDDPPTVVNDTVTSNIKTK